MDFATVLISMVIAGTASVVTFVAVRASQPKAQTLTARVTRNRLR